jgi:hypothetical protein
MANICLYKIKVIGMKKACYALVNMTPLYAGEKQYLYESGTDEEFTLIFLGTCKCGINAYTVPMKNPRPLTDEELDAIKEGDHWDKTLIDKSILLNCEIFCDSKEMDDYCYSIYEHYNRGKKIYDNSPENFHIN